MEWVGPVPLWAPNRSGGSVGAVAMIIIYPGALSDLSPASSVVSPCVVGSATVSVQAADRCHDTNQLLLLTLDPLALARDIFRFSQWTIPPSPPFPSPTGFTSTTCVPEDRGPTHTQSACLRTYADLKLRGRVRTGGVVCLGC